MDRKKITWILILQAWAMLWVVIGHSPLKMPISVNDPVFVKILYDIAYSFHMPLFVFVSGYLFFMTRMESNWGGDFIIMKDKFQRLGIPFVFFTIVAMVMKKLFSADMARPSEISICELVNAILFPGNGPLGELWFIAVIMWCFALKPVWDLILIHFCYAVICAVVLMALHFSLLFQNIDFLCISQTCNMMIYFFIGLMCRRWNKWEKFNKKYIPLILMLACYICSRMFNNSVWFMALTPFAGIGTSVFFAMILAKYMPNLFSSFRNYTYQIYLMGIFVQIFIKVIYVKLGYPYSFGYWLCVLGGIYVPVIISKIVERINWGPLCLCIGLKSKSK